MANYSTQNISLTAGTSPTFNSAATGGDTVTVGNVERDFLLVKNGGASSITLTIAPQVASIYQDGVGYVTPPTLTYTVAAAGQEAIGPFPSAYINSSNGQVSLSWSTSASVTFAALTLPAVSRGFM